MALVDSNFVKIHKLSTPFFVYDLNIIKRQFLRLKRLLPGGIQIFYSVKTNPHLKILKFMEGLGLGTEITSGGEFNRVQKVKFPPSRIIFTSPGKTDDELKRAIKSNIYLIIAESLTELQRIDLLAGELNKKQAVLLRVNTRFRISQDYSMRSLTGVPSKFGIDEEKLSNIVCSAAKFKNIRLRGLHSYCASGVLDYKLIIEHIRYFFIFVKKISADTGIDFDVIDVGGGLGINYSGASNKNFEIKKFSTELNGLIKRHGFNDKKIIMEIGRFLVAESADYIARILDIKFSRGVKFIIVDGGINHLSRAGISEENHQVELLSKEKSSKKDKADIAGRLSYPSDFISKNVLIPSCKVGDLLAIRRVGAYGLTAGMVNFSSHPLPEEVFLPV